jgi:nucleobase:cation symporter-1, NCS1 family
MNMELEQQTIRPISLSERHGRARDLFTVWFGTNLMLLTVVTGALAVTVFHLPLISAILSLTLGNLVGGVFMALHAAQGPTLGVPQMVQTRGQFGSVGALVVITVVVVMYVGFFASNLALGADTLRAIALPIPEIAVIVLLGVLSITVTVLGYDLIHACTRFITYASGAAFALTLAWLAIGHSLPTDLLSRNTVTLQGTLGAVSVAALWQIAYAPYVSDYSRYLPPETGVRPAFWASYWGSVLGSTLPMIVGTVIGLLDQGRGVIATLGALTKGIAPVTFVIFSIAMLANNAMNVYCGALSTLTAVQTWRPAWNPGWRARAVVAIILLAIALSLAILGHDSFLESYTSFILLLFYVLIPWTAINLVDYYLVRHGEYDVASFLRHDGGIYGRYNVPAIVCYFLGTLVQLPFVSTPLYRGPVARALGDADLSWLVGLAVTSVSYYAFAKRSTSTAPAAVKLSELVK